MEKKLLSLKEKTPGGASRNSWMGGFDEREVEGMSGIENLTEELEPKIVYSKYNIQRPMVYGIHAGHVRNGLLDLRRSARISGYNPNGRNI